MDRFVVRILGAGCHGAHPDDGKDPIPAAIAMVQAYQTILTRNINAFHPALISVTKLQAGNTWNVIPERAELEGTVRTMEPEDRALFEERMRVITEETARAYGVHAELEWIAGPPAVRNDADMAEESIRIAERMGFQVVPEETSMGGDDFSFYEDSIPGCYIKIGTGKGPTIHQPGFRINEAAILPAVRYVAELFFCSGQ